MKIKVKLIIIFLSLFTTLSLIIGFLSYYAANSIIIDNYTKKTEENLDFVYDITEQHVFHFKDTIKFLTASDILYNRMSPSYSDYSDLEQVTAHNELNYYISNFVNFDFYQSISNIYVYNLDGVAFKSNIGILSSSQQEQYVEIAENYTFDSNYNLQYIQEQTYIQPKTELLRFYKPLHNSVGELYAYFFIDLEAEYFFEMISTDNLEADTVLYIVNSDDRILHSSKATEIGKDFVYPTESSIIKEKNMSSFSWRIISITPSDIVTGDSKVILNQLLLLTILFICIAAIFIVILSNRITTPISKLVRGMEKVRNGDLDVYVPKSSRDEIGDMTETFNTMTADLNQLIEQKILFLKEVNDEKYKVLQSQINPHFMYNTLNTVKFMAQMQNATNIMNIIDLISNLLRLASHTKGQFISLSSEMEIVDTYIKIQQIRYNYKFKFNCDISEDSLGVIVPKFIVQPIVENAIFHGIEPKKGMGLLEIKCYTQDDTLYILIKDNGVGMSPEKINKVLSDKTMDSNGLNGIGVPNVNNRLIRLFGEKHALKIYSNEREGTSMLISIPIDHNYI